MEKFPNVSTIHIIETKIGNDWFEVDPSDRFLDIDSALDACKELATINKPHHFRVSNRVSAVGLFVE